MRFLAATFLLLPLTSAAQNYQPLDFSGNVQAMNAIYPNMSTLGPEYYNGLTLDFTNVTTRDGQAVDARVTIFSTTGAYDFVGWIPGYNSLAGQPAGDLGHYYRHLPDVSEASGGVSFSLSFYEGGGAFTTPAVLSDFRILIYDHDGEPGQSESIRTYLSDGFSGYQIHNGSNISAVDENGAWRFDSGGMNLTETGPDGGFIAYYRNTSSLRFDMLATTYPGNPSQNNGIFTAFDGDLSLLGGDASGFGSFVSVPEPSVPLLAASALSLLLGRRSRPVS